MGWQVNKRTGERRWVDPQSAPAQAGPRAIPIGPRNSKPAADMANDATRVEFERRRVALAEQEAASKQAQEARAAALAQQKADIDRRTAEVTAPIRKEALTEFQAALDLYPKLGDLESKFAKGPGATKGLMGLLDYLPNVLNPGAQTFDTAANQLRGTIKKTENYTAGEGNTVDEAKMNVGAFIPDSTDLDSTTRENLKALRGQQAKGFATAVKTLGGIPDQNGNVTPVPQGYRVGQYPPLDAEVARLISSVPPPKRGEFLLNAKRHFEQRQATHKRPGATGARQQQPDVIDFHDYRGH